MTAGLPKQGLRCIVIGAGPAGLTAAYELLERTGIHPIVLEKSDCVGGISRTVNYKGNRIDIGGHRFFSKSDRVMNWWFSHLPVQSSEAPGLQTITYQGKQRPVMPTAGAASADPDAVLLLRPRKSRIFFLRKLFDYPISLSSATLSKLGLLRSARIGLSYLRRALRPLPVENNLEQFFINRFGEELYKTFFKSYTEKVWGVPCQEIDAEWGAQRIKGLSIWKTVQHQLKKLLPSRRTDVAQKGTETSLIEQFLYPKFGPGQMWEEVARKVVAKGGELHLQQEICEVRVRQGRVVSVVARDPQGAEHEYAGDYFFSTMPVQELVQKLDCPVPAEVKAISDGLQYRDFITVGLLLSDLALKEKGSPLIQDNWIYIQEPDVLAGRLQIFNNWSPSLVAKPGTVWIGVEYFCQEGDALWRRSDADLQELAKDELARLGILRREQVLDATVLRMPKTYPAYFGTYAEFDKLRAWIDQIPNLFLVGRNGMHKYNNQDHSMLTAMVAVDNIVAGRTDKSNLWSINTEMDYHEEA